MANLREIKGRIDSVTSTMQVTRTMEMISTAKIRKALDQAKEAEPYKDAITRMLANVAGAGFDESQPLLQPREEEHNVLFILVASDRGMAGGFNIVPQRMVQHEMAELEAKGIEGGLDVLPRHLAVCIDELLVVADAAFPVALQHPDVPHAK